jgi:hypothetical protein
MNINMDNNNSLASRDGETESTEPSTPSNPTEPSESTERSNVPYHRHCQTTICSLKGHTDTSSIVDRWEDDLLNIAAIDHNWNWKSEFTNGSMVDDFKATLDIIDKVAQKVLSGITLTFNDCDGNVVGSGTASSDATNCVIDNFGRSITLTVDDE